ncbi:NAD(P)-dependent oxidoreductase [Litorilinea aerophila]|uniref:NAD(P)-dependent oxidoreductase n=1 Tax=Litorilinea aerophila TaxID=1204385 RepID=A0A540VI64_9CHLR|nr:NAD(P)-dependent oxidoreductase [Litorilinea aerophila]MCC9076091.1 NAD(P)-dependent oxidoreductase [Litorilinea aerophila]
MRIFVAGSTGALGKALVPLLLEHGYEVIALTRSAEKARALATLGAQPSIADPLDRDALTAAVRQAEPEVIVHQLTALADATGNFKRFDQEFALTNRLRTEVTDTLLAAARLVGARRFIVQSYCGWPFARVGGPVKTEEDPLDPNPPASFRQTLAAIRYLEDAVCNATDVEALALRYGMFYGPGTGIAQDGRLVELVRKRRFPIVGNGAGIWSFIHIEDAARATVAAITHGSPGIYNIVDDEPAPVAVWLPFLANAVGAKPPRKVPVWLARLLIGAGGVSMMTKIRGGSNAKAKRELRWQPIYPSWRRGFVEGLGENTATRPAGGGAPPNGAKAKPSTGSGDIRWRSASDMPKGCLTRRPLSRISHRVELGPRLTSEKSQGVCMNA